MWSEPAVVMKITLFFLMLGLMAVLCVKAFIALAQSLPVFSTKRQDYEVDLKTEVEVFIAYGRYEQAMILVEQAIEANPDRFDAYELLQLRTKATDLWAKQVGMS